MRGTFRIPPAPPVESGPLVPRDVDGERRFFDRPCYEFNRQLDLVSNDLYCEHCRHYLTARCPHIDEFLDDVEDLTPE